VFAWTFSPLPLFSFTLFFGRSEDEKVLSGGMRMAQELRSIADFYDFMIWMVKHVELRRHRHYSLNIAIESRLQAFSALLLHAKYSKEEGGALGERQY
jgi:hypothetical protein